MAKDKAYELDASLHDPKVAKSYIPDGYDDLDEFLLDMRKEYEQCQLSDDTNRKEAIDDKKFAAGDQWDPQVVKQRAGLPCLTINSIPQFTAQLVGDWRQSRNSIRVLPADGGDIQIANMRGDLIRSIEYKSRADRVFDSAFESTVTCGDGAFRIAVEYSRDDVFDQDIFVRPIDDALSVTWDRLSVDPTGRDARKCWVEDTIPTAEFNRKWPDQDPSNLSQQAQGTLRHSNWLTTDTVKVTEYWRMIERDRLLGLFEDGSTHVIDEKTMDDLVERHGPPVKTRISKCLYAQMHLVTGYAILAGPFEYKLNRLPIIRMMGRVVNVEGDRIRYGLVRFMKDAVRLRNFWRSVAAEQLGYAPKAQWLATEGAVAGKEERFRKAHLTRDPLLIYNDGEEIPKRIQAPEIQAALFQSAEINVQDMKDVTGIHDASLGIRSNETSGKAIMARQKEGDVASITFYDNGNASILEAGDVINQLIPQIYDGTRIVRLVGDDEAIKLQKINDPHDPESPDLSVGNYDVMLSTGASYTTRRAEAADAMMQAVQVYPEIMQLAGDLVIKAQDWPGAEELSARIKKTIPPQLLSPEEQQQMQQDGSQPAEGQDPAQMQMMQEEFAKMQEELQRLSEENLKLTVAEDIKREELQIKRFEAQTDRMKVEGELELKEDAQDVEMLTDVVGKHHEKSMKEEDHSRQMEMMDKQAKLQPKPEAKPSAKK